MLTGGVLGLGSLFDLCSLGTQVDQANRILLLEKLVSNSGWGKQVNGGEIADRPCCPYCLKVLKSSPTRRVRCRFCRNIIYIKPKQTIFTTTLLKKDDAIAVDYLKALAKFAVTESDYLAEQAELGKWFGEAVNSTDVIWSLFKQVSSRTRDLELLKSIQHTMALFLKEGDYDCYSLLQRLVKRQLLDFQKKGIKKVRIQTAGIDSCSACRQLEGKVYTIKRALQEMPLPHKECSYKLSGVIKNFCQCEYSAE